MSTEVKLQAFESKKLNEGEFTCFIRPQNPDFFYGINELILLEGRKFMVMRRDFMYNVLHVTMDELLSMGFLARKMKRFQERFTKYWRTSYPGRYMAYKYYIKEVK